MSNKKIMSATIFKNECKKLFRFSFKVGLSYYCFQLRKCLMQNARIRGKSGETF